MSTLTDEDDTSYRTLFDPPPAASRMASIRFGNPRDVVVLFEDNNTNEKSEYIRGLLFIAVITLMLFMTWALCLCIFMCLGKERVGYFSGRPFERETPRADDEDQDGGREETEKQKSRKQLYNRGDPWGSKASTNRLLFLFSGLVVIVFSVLLVTRGLTQLQATVDTVHDNSVVVQNIVTDSRQVIESGLQSLKNRASSLRITLLNELNRDIFCPEDTSMENSAIGREVRKQVDSVVDLLDELEDFQDDTLADLDETLVDVWEAANSVEEAAEEKNLLGWKTMIVLIPYTIITALLMAATVMAFFDVSFIGLNRLIDFVLLPTFILMTMGACVLASITAVAAAINSDFCLPNGDENASPDANVVDIMMAEGFVETDFQLSMIRYYVYQCTATTGVDDPFASLKTYLPDMRDNQQALAEVIKTLRDDDKLSELSMYCNREFDALDAQLDNMKVILSVLVNSLEKFLDLLSCQRIVPIYTDTIYDASCAYSTKALFWIFCCSIILGTFGLIMITFRASYKLTREKIPPRYLVGSDEKPHVVKNLDNRTGYDHDDDGSEHRHTPEPAKPLDPHPEEIRVDKNTDDMFSTYTGNVSNESAPMSYNAARYADDYTVTREKKAQAIDVD